MTALLERRTNLSVEFRAPGGRVAHRACNT